MRASTMMSALCAGLAVAAPMLEKKAVVTDIETKIVYVYVTEGQLPATTTPSVPHVQVHQNPHHTTTTVVVPQVQAVPTPSTTSTPPPPPPPAPTTSTPPPPPPAPTTTSVAPTKAVVENKVAVEATSAAAPVATEASAAPTDDSFEGKVLYHHNVHRANHSAPDVTYDDTIAGYAAQVAKTCVYGHDLTAGGGGYGQNIAAYGTTESPESIGAPQIVAQAISNMWYNGEVNTFPSSDFGKATPDMSNFEKWGHFSQVVWKGTTGVGCASQYCAAGTVFPSMGSWFTVCNYSPAGNMGGAYGTNVAKPLGQATVSA